MGKKINDPARTSADSPVRALRSDQQFRRSTRRDALAVQVSSCLEGQIFHFQTSWKHPRLAGVIDYSVGRSRWMRRPYILETIERGPRSLR